jgi:hypothetical protein
MKVFIFNLIFLTINLNFAHSAYGEIVHQNKTAKAQINYANNGVLFGIINDLIVGKSTLKVSRSCSTNYCGCYNNSDHYGNCSNFIVCCPGYNCVGGATAGWGKCE